jgi:hypothetical protein
VGLVLAIVYGACACTCDPMCEYMYAELRVPLHVVCMHAAVLLSDSEGCVHVCPEGKLVTRRALQCLSSWTLQNAFQTTVSYCRLRHVFYEHFYVFVQYQQNVFATNALQQKTLIRFPSQAPQISIDDCGRSRMRSVSHAVAQLVVAEHAFMCQSQEVNSSIRREISYLTQAYSPSCSIHNMQPCLLVLWLQLERPGRNMEPVPLACLI